MKKLIILFILFSISSYTITMANNNSILDVSVNFCNNNHITKSLSIEYISGQSNEICMQFINSSNKDILVGYEFVDGVMTSDIYNTKACNNTAVDGLFSSFFVHSAQKISIKSQSIVTQKDYILTPDGLTGIVNGCLTYFVLQNNTPTNDTDMFDVVVRKASFIDMFPKGALDTYAVDVKDQTIEPKMNLVISSRLIAYAVVTLIIIMFTIITLVKQHRR